MNYEGEVRDSLLAELIEIAESGATLDQLNQALTKIVAQPTSIKF